MRTTTLARQLHLLLATAVLGAGAACGGAIAQVDDGNGDGGAYGKKQDDADTQNTTTGDDEMVDGSDIDTGIDADHGPLDGGHKDGALSDVSHPDVFTGCATGITDPDPALCCATPGDAACGGGPGGDQCTLDCHAVCEKMAPGSMQQSWAFANCYWSQSATDPKIGYTCGQCGVGRIPGDTRPCDRGASVAERLATQAYYEAVSVVAFERLARVLAQFGAPADLIARVSESAADETRHAVLFARLARERGAVVAEPELDARTPSLFDLAMENATEGCVRETYGALVALHQAAHAEDTELRDAFGQIAEDEIAHAALSLDLARWFDGVLSGADRARVAHARRHAEQELLRGVDAPIDLVDGVLGLPSPRIARVLASRLFGAVIPALDAAA